MYYIVPPYTKTLLVKKNEKRVPLYEKRGQNEKISEKTPLGVGVLNIVPVPEYTQKPSK